MKLTTEQLKNEIWGTGCGSVPENESALSHPLVIDFIDTFFDGELTDIDCEDNLLIGGQPSLAKLTITNEEFDRFTSFDKNGVMDTLAGYFEDILDIPYNEEIMEEYGMEEFHPEIICVIFSAMVDYFGGSLRCEYMGEDQIEIESE